MRFFIMIGIIGFLGACEPEGDNLEWERAVVLHELTHWLGVHGHTADRDSAMYYQMMGIDHYTGADEDLICEWLECSHNADPPKEIWVDHRCPETVVALILDSVEEINGFGHDHMGHDLVNVVGTTDTDDLPSVQFNPGYADGDRIAHANEHTVSLYMGPFQI